MSTEDKMASRWQIHTGVFRRLGRPVRVGTLDPGSSRLAGQLKGRSRSPVRITNEHQAHRCY